MAARIRKQLGIEPEMVHGAYGEFRVLVEGETVVDGGALAFVGVLPPVTTVLEAVRRRIAP